MAKGISLQKHFDKYLVDKQKKTPPEVFYKKGAIKDFSKFRRKHLCQSLFINKAKGLGFSKG